MNTVPWPTLNPDKKLTEPTQQNAEQAPEAVWTFWRTGKSLALTGNRAQNLPTRDYIDCVHPTHEYIYIIYTYTNK